MNLLSDHHRKIRRRTLLQRGLQFGAGMLLATVANSCAPTTPSQISSLPELNKESPRKIRIGYWRGVSGLPLYLALEQGIFARVGLDVEAIAFTSSLQIAEAMIEGKIDGFANSTTSGALALAEISRPSLFKIFATNPRSANSHAASHMASDEIDKFIVLKDSAIASTSELNGMRVGCMPGWQNLAIARAILQKIGTEAEVAQIEPNRQIAALRSGQIAAVYSLEPTGVSHQDTKTLESGVFAKYLLGDPMALWAGGSAALSTEFIARFPVMSKKYIAAYTQAIHAIRAQPIAALTYLKGYTEISADLGEAVLLSAHKLYDEFTTLDINQLQQFFDAMHRDKVFTSKVSFISMLYQA
jgi:NitT/TauT family transport system substrate-binding protein